MATQVPNAVMKLRTKSELCMVLRHTNNRTTFIKAEISVTVLFMSYKYLHLGQT